MNRNSANQYNPDIAEYNRLSMPVVSLSWIFIAIAAMGVIYGLASISAIAFIPNKSYTFLALSAPIPNLSRNPTICQTSQFSIKLSEISTAFVFVIPFIWASFCGSYFKTCIVSSPNLFIIFDAVAGPTPLIFPALTSASNSESAVRKSLVVSFL